MMVDYDTKVRAGYNQVLNGAISYELGVIPVVDEKLDTQISEHDIYIKLSSQQGQQQNNKKYFAATCTVNIDIVQRTKSVGGKLVVDDVAGQVVQLLFPTRTTTAITLSSPLKLTISELQNTNTEPLRQIDSGFLTIKTLTFSNRVIQDA